MTDIQMDGRKPVIVWLRRIRMVLSRWQLYALLAPAVVTTLLFHYYPIYGIQIAFKNYRNSRGIWGSSWVGLKHFQSLFSYVNFDDILRNTISISLYSIAVFPCAVIFALMLNEVRNLRFKRGVQMISYAPHFISTVVVVSMLQIFMQRSNGLINNVIAMLGGERIDFLSIPQYFSTIFVWFTTYFGWVDGTFRMLDESEIQSSILAAIGGVIAWIFKPLGWGNWQAAVASITGLVAKENIVGTLGILYGGGDGTVYQNIGAAFTGISGFSFLVFNLLCAPCFAAIGAIKREMNNRKWTWFAIGYQCGFAYLISLMINQFGGLFTGSVNVIGLIFAVAALALMVYMLVRPYKEATKLNATV